MPSIQSTVQAVPVQITDSRSLSLSERLQQIDHAITAVEVAALLGISSPRTTATVNPTEGSWHTPLSLGGVPPYLMAMFSIVYLGELGNDFED
jgi:hypothetical protein